MSFQNHLLTSSAIWCNSHLFSKKRRSCSPCDASGQAFVFSSRNACRPLAELTVLMDASEDAALCFLPAQWRKLALGKSMTSLRVASNLNSRSWGWEKTSALPLLLSLLNFKSVGIICTYTNFGTAGEVLVELYNTLKSDLSSFIEVCIYCELNVGLCTKYQCVHVQFIR